MSFPLLHSAAGDGYVVAEAPAALLGHEEEGPTRGMVRVSWNAPWVLGHLAECQRSNGLSTSRFLLDERNINF